MLSKNKLKKRVKPLLLILLVIIPINFLFLNIQMNANFGNDDLLDEEVLEDDPNVPKSSQFKPFKITINSTEIYENGTFFLMQEDSLRFEFFNSSHYRSVSDVDLNVQDLGISNQQFYHVDDVSWILNYTFTGVSIGEYDSNITIVNNSITHTFDFKLNIGNPNLLITQLTVIDSVYNPGGVEIVEQGIYSTYRGTTLGFNVNVYNKVGGVDKVVLNYSDGVDTDISTELSAGAASPPNYPYTFPGTIDVSIDFANRDRWKPTENLYPFILKANDSESDYIFEFYLEIINDPPLITEFDLSPSYIPNPSGDTTTITVTANASDLEDDPLYDGGTERTVKYTDPVLKIEEGTGCIVNAPIPNNLNHLKVANGTDYYDMTMLETGGEFTVWLDVNDEINLNKITSFETKVKIRHNSTWTGLNGDIANLWIYDYNAFTWRLLSNLTHSYGKAWYTVVNQSSTDLPGSAQDYYSPVNKTVKLRFQYDHGSEDANLRIDYIDITTSLTRRDTFSRVVLSIYHPGEDIIPTSMEIINYWDSGSDVWSYDYEIENSPENYGSWTFQIFFMDHGTKPYVAQIWGNFSVYPDRPSTSEYSYGYNEQSEKFGQTQATKILAIGIDSSEALNISSLPTTNSSSGTNIPNGEVFNITLDVSGIDSSQSWYYTDVAERENIVSLSLLGNISNTFTTAYGTNAGGNMTVANAASANYLDLPNDGLNFTLDARTADTYPDWANFTVYLKLDYSNSPDAIQSFELSMRMLDNYSGTINSAYATIYDYNVGIERNFRDLRNVASTYTYYNTSSSSLPGQAGDYFNPIDNTAMIKFWYYSPNPNPNVSITIDYINIYDIPVDHQGQLKAYNIRPQYNVSGFFTNISIDDGTPYVFTMQRNLSQYFAYTSAIWKVKLSTKWWLSSENITEISVEIDSWFNTITDIADVYLEFWNFNISKWEIPSTGTWNGGGTGLITDDEATSNFLQIVTDSNDLNNFIDSGNNVYMRMRIVYQDPGEAQNYQLSIDFINISIKLRNYYSAELNFDSAINGNTIIKLVPYAKSTLVMQYSAIIDTNALGLYADNFTLYITVQNGNSSIWYIGYRIGPRVITKGGYTRYFLYDPDDEIDYLNKDFTINVYNPPITASKEVSLNKLVFSLETGSSVQINGTIDIGTISSTNPKLNYEIRIRKGTDTTYSSWRTRAPTVLDDINDEWAFAELIDNYDLTYYTIGVYYISFYARGPYGQEVATEWREFRINNFQPVDFQFKFSDGATVTIERGKTYPDEITPTFDFSFSDYDMPEMSDATARANVQLRFLVRNKSAGDAWEWLDAYMESNEGKTSNRHEFKFSLYIPKTVTTGPYSTIYNNWEFIVSDPNGGMQSQISYVNYTGTDFVIQNIAPEINNFDNNDSQIFRTQTVEISLKTNDTEDEPDQWIEILNISVSAPGSGYDLVVTNNSIQYDIIHGTRYIVYTTNRTQPLGYYNVSVFIQDSDNRVVSDSITNAFRVSNNRPQVVGYDVTPNSSYRVLNPTGLTNVTTITVNITDIEDSWIGDNYTTDSSGNSPYIEIYHIDYGNDIDKIESTDYRSLIQRDFPGGIEPLKLNLTIVNPGNNSNGNIETWMTQVQFNQTIDGYYLFAGNLSIEVYVTDSDGGTNAIKALTNEFGEKDIIEIVNHAPKKIMTQFTQLGMTEPNYYAIDAEGLSFGDSFDIWFFITDKEGIAKIIINLEFEEVAPDFTFTSSNWDYHNLSGVDAYQCTIDTDDDKFPKYTFEYFDDKSFKVYSFSILDKDFGYKNVNWFNQSSGKFEYNTKITHDPKFSIEMEDIPTLPPEEPVVLWWLMVIVLIAIGAVVVVGVIWIRKKTGWRRFMD